MSKKAEILLVLKDKFTDPIKKATQSQESFAEKTRELNKRLDELNGKKISLKVDLARATKDMNDAKKAYLQLNDEVSRTNYEKAIEQHESLKKQLAEVEEQSKAASRGLSDLRSEASKLDNMGGGAAGEGSGSDGGGTNSFMGTASAIMGSQLFSQLTSSASAYLGANISSAYGSAVGDSVANIGGGILTGAGAGASMGMMFGPWGAAIGGAIGAGVGLISGLLKDGAQKQGEKDDLFRGVVENIYDEVFAMREEMVSQGSALAAQRETNLTAFSTLLRSEVAVSDDVYGPSIDPKWYADQFMGEVLEYARTTPFGYEELVNISKTLLTYGYASERIIPMLTQIGDAGAALGWDASAKVSAATYIGRMQMSDKVTMQYLNPLISQGLDVIGYIRQSLEHDNAGITNADVMELVSKGELSGKAVSEVLLEYMGFDFGGSMEELQNSFDGLTSTLEDWEDEMNAALGEGYNERRKEQMKTQIDWYEEHADELTEMYRLVGEYEADLLGAKEETMRTSFEDLLERTKDITDPSQMSQELYNAIADAKIAYYDTEAYDGLYESQQALVNRLQKDLAATHWDCGYALGQEFTKGYKSATLEVTLARLSDGPNSGYDPELGVLPPHYYSGPEVEETPAATPGPSATPGPLLPPGGYAYGLDRVPYDNFPALLHEGERVLTAAQARAADAERGGARSMTINIYNPTVREDSDIDAIANAIYERLAAADATYVG
ncbi:MAG: tape measure protein [Clostridia bacterium]|nr:tape measure protein [Clostridia bacterium]